MERTNDGFVVAEEDLRLRGEGNLVGTEQSGKRIFEHARMNDIELMSKAREISEELLRDDPALSHHAALKEIVTQMRATSHRE